MTIPGWGHSRATWREAGHYSVGLFKHHSPGGASIGYVRIGIIIHCTFSSFISIRFWMYMSDLFFLCLALAAQYESSYGRTVVPLSTPLGRM